MEETRWQNRWATPRSSMGDGQSRHVPAGFTSVALAGFKLIQFQSQHIRAGSISVCSITA